MAVDFCSGGDGDGDGDVGGGDATCVPKGNLKVISVHARA